MKSQRMQECFCCGKSGCMSYYCFRLGLTIFHNKDGSVWWKGKPSIKKNQKSGGLGGGSTPHASQGKFNFGDGSTEPF